MKTHSLLKKQVTKKQVTTFAVSRDNKLLAYATNEEDYIKGNSIFVYELEAQKQVAQMQSGNFRTIKFLLFIPGTSYLAYVFENEVAINDISTGETISQIKVPAKVSAVSMIGDKLAISFLSGIVFLSTGTWEAVEMSSEFENLIYVRGYGDVYAGVNKSGEIILNDIKNKSQVVFKTPFICTSVQLSENREIISGSCYSAPGFYLFGTKTRQEIKSGYPFSSIKVPAWDFNSSASRLALAADTGMVTVLDTTGFETLAFEAVHKGPISNLLFMGESIVTSGLDGKILVSTL